MFTERAAAIRKNKPVEPFLPVFSELPASAKTPPKTFIFHRGDPMNPKGEVEPKELTILTSAGTHAFGTRPNAAKANPATSGRRLGFAQHITSGNHPLLTRVLVNRVWHHHFGRGIVGKAVKDIVSHHNYHATLMHLFGLDHEKVTFPRNGSAMKLRDNKGGRIVTDLLV